MTDDIVTQLREGEKWHRNGYVEVPSGFYEFLANEIERERKTAADEIEWLRKQYQRASERAEYWAQMYDELTEIANSKLADNEEIDVDDE